MEERGDTTLFSRARGGLCCSLAVRSRDHTRRAVPYNRSFGLGDCSPTLDHLSWKCRCMAALARAYVLGALLSACLLGFSSNLTGCSRHGCPASSASCPRAPAEFSFDKAEECSSKPQRTALIKSRATLRAALLIVRVDVVCACLLFLASGCTWNQWSLEATPCDSVLLSQRRRVRRFLSHVS